jgi:hypothetical protein
VIPRLGLLALVALLAVAGLGCSGGETKEPVVAKASRPDSEVLAIFGERLASFDPRTLEQVSRESLSLPGGAWSPVFSPTGELVAVGGRGNAGVQIIDPGRLKVVGRLARASAERSLEPLAWADEHRLLALEFAWMQGPDVPHVQDLLVLDPVARRIATRRPLHGWATQTARAGSDLVLLVEPAEGIRPARLIVAGAGGSLRTVALDRVLAGGREDFQGDEVRFHFQSSGLAVDPADGRAYVVGAGSLLAEIDLRTLAVSYHELSEPGSLLSRLRDWLDPAAEAKITFGWSREATWLGNGLIAVSGSDYHGLRSAAAGLKLIDVQAGTLRTLEPRASFHRVAEDVLFAAGAESNGETNTETGMGLTAYTLEGQKLWHALADEPVWWLDVAGGYVYIPLAGSDTTAVRVIELATGQLAGEVKGDMPTFLSKDATAR